MNLSFAPPNVTLPAAAPPHLPRLWKGEMEESEAHSLASLGEGENQKEEREKLPRH